MDLKKMSLKVGMLAQKVGAYIKNQRGLVTADKISDKSLNNLVSYVDKQAETLIVEGLKKILPEAGFLTEEATIEQEDKSLRWIIDPLDGTTNFLFGLPIYSVSIALVEGENILLGVVYIPELQELFSATKGGGAFLNNEAISVSKTQKLSESLVATGMPYYKFDHLERYMKMFYKYMKGTRGIRRMGSAAVDLVYVACGRFDFYFEFDLNPWDVAAGLLIVEEAGGKTSNFNGKKSALPAVEILASNGLLHEAVLEEV